MIEDSLPVRTYLTRILEKHRFAVIHAETLAAGLMRLRNDKPDVATLDLSLPDSKSRWDTLRTFMTAAKIPVVVCSKDVSDSLVEEAERLGAVEYVWSLKGGPREADILDAMEKAVRRTILTAKDRVDAERWAADAALFAEARKLAEEMSR